MSNTGQTAGTWSGGYNGQSPGMGFGPGATQSPYGNNPVRL